MNTEDLELSTSKSIEYVPNGLKLHIHKSIYELSIHSKCRCSTVVRETDNNTVGSRIVNCFHML